MYLQQIRNATIFYIMAEKNINWSFRASSSSFWSRMSLSLGGM